MTDWILRKYTELDYDQFLKWRKVIARRNKTPEFIKWEYLNGPWGPAETWIAEDNGKIVGQYSTQRYESFYFGQKMIASYSFDTGSHPKYFHPKKNIFQSLGNKFFEEEAKQNIHFSTGFPNEYFVYGGLRFGWKIVSPVPLLENSNITKISLENSTKFEIEKISTFDEDFESFSEMFKDEISIYLNRTRKYLNWRFIEKPNLKEPKYHYDYINYKIMDKSGELVSYLVFKEFLSENGKILHLIDFLVPENEELYRAILRQTVEIAKRDNINTISLFSNRYHSFSEFLTKFGFNYTDTKRKFIVRNNTNILDDKDLFDEKNHFITMGDHDVY